MLFRSVVVVSSTVVVVASLVVVSAAVVSGTVVGAASSPPPHEASRARGRAATARRREERIWQVWHRAPSGSRQWGPVTCHTVSPLAPDAVGSIVSITPAALATLCGLRDTEPDASELGLRLEIISEPGADFQYDLSFDVITKAAFTDEVRTHRDGELSLKEIGRAHV